MTIGVIVSMDKIVRSVRPYWFLSTLITILGVATYISFQHFSIDLSTFLAILLPALVGIFGSYGLALRRKVNEKRRLRKALFTELDKMAWFYNWPTEDSSTPNIMPISTTIYEENADSLGILSDEEITYIVEFYSIARIIEGSLEYHQNKLVKAQSHLLGQDIGKKTRKRSIANQLDILTLSHQRALITIRNHLDEFKDLDLNEGAKLRPDNPVIQRNEVLCREYGLITRIDENLYRLTKEGADFFQGKKELGALKRTKTLEKRNKTVFYKIVEQLLAGLNKIIS